MKESFGTIFILETQKNFNLKLRFKKILLHQKGKTHRVKIHFI